MAIFKANQSKDEIMNKLDVAIEEARKKMNNSIEENGTLAQSTIKLSQELDPLVVAKQRMLNYGC
jgi:regulator of replication initiation timing